ncbi:uncharacterized protein [Chiloscyllium punctatum]|uniref:uncharacterized protein n=1 Tax=Chiloscyllium punctatum TaxID=137246 RepID=UPI003B6427D4
MPTPNIYVVHGLHSATEQAVGLGVREPPQPAVAGDCCVQHPPPQIPERKGEDSRVESPPLGIPTARWQMGTPRRVRTVDEGEEVDGVQQQSIQGLPFDIFEGNKIKIPEAAQVVGHRLPQEVRDLGANVKFRPGWGERGRDPTAHLSILQLVHYVGSEHRRFKASNGGGHIPDVFRCPARYVLRQRPAQAPSTQHVPDPGRPRRHGPPLRQPLEPASMEVRIPEQRLPDDSHYSSRRVGAMRFDHVPNSDQVLVKDRQHLEGDLQTVTVDEQELRVIVEVVHLAEKIRRQGTPPRRRLDVKVSPQGLKAERRDLGADAHQRLTALLDRETQNLRGDPVHLFVPEEVDQRSLDVSDKARRRDQSDQPVPQHGGHQLVYD